MVSTSRSKQLVQLVALTTGLLWFSWTEAATVLVTGANRGIGLEFSKQYAAKGWKVIATHRRPENPATLKALSAKYPASVVIERLDVQDHAMIEDLAKKFEGEPIDLLINNAGIFGSLTNRQEQMFGTLDHTLFDSFMHTNVLGPIKISEAFLENIKASDRKQIVIVSATAGSFALNSRNPYPGGYFYKASKAALNIAFVSLAKDTKRFGITVTILSPGQVKVEKLADHTIPGQISPEESISGMIRVIESQMPTASGRFFDYKGKSRQW